tara:strand:- start:2768 stop:3112 length:345 start_codon:yes stop_codon:yes gene_type:complete
MAIEKHPWVVTPDPADGALKLWRRSVALAVDLLRRGKIQPIGSVTLTANAATTTLADPNIGGNSIILLDARTANAAAEEGAGTLYKDAPGDGSIVINHANNVQTDRTFQYVVLG